MKMKKTGLSIIKILLFSFVFIIYSCVKEDPDLVSPPPIAETVNVRFINLSPDSSPLKLNFEGSVETDNVPYGQASEVMHPPADSSFLSVIRNGTSIFKLYNPVRYIRDSDYTIFAVPSPKDSLEVKIVDTLIVQRSFALPPTGLRNISFLRMFNGNPDQKVFYTLRLGCPNGPALFNYVSFKQVMNQMVQMNAGNNPVTLIKRVDNQDYILDLYDLVLDSLEQYTVIVKPESDGSESLLLLNEQSQSITALQPLSIIPERTTKIRPINLSSKSINYELATGEPIGNEIASNTVGSFQTISACNSQEPDIIIAKESGSFASEVEYSLSVLTDYSLITFDSETEPAGKTMLVEPIRLNQALGNNSAVRVINASGKYQSINLSMGARLDPNDNLQNFSSGDYLAEKLNFGEIATPTVVAPGKVPILLFTNTSPQDLLFTTQIEFQAGKSYLLVILNDSQGNPLLTAIEDEAQSQKAEFAPQGVFVQVVNGVGGKKRISLNLTDLLTDARVYQSGSLATVLFPGNYNINIEDNTHEFQAKLNEGVLIVATGYEDNISIYSFSTPSMKSSLSEYKRRFVNLSDIELVAVKNQENPSAKDAPPAPVLFKLTQNSLTFPESKNRAESTQFFFFDDALLETDPKSDKFLLQLTDVRFNLGKNYTIIFTGLKEKGYYTAIIQQEY